MSQMTAVARRPRVLVADDDQILRMLLREALEPQGFRVEEAADGGEALDIYERAHPELVLLDVVMPVMDGFATCTALRSTPGGRYVPVIVMTGVDDVDSVRTSYEAGATDFITKPVNFIILAQRIRYILRARRAFDELYRSEERLASAQRIARIGTWEWNSVEGVLWLSRELRNVLGLSQTASIRSCEDLLASVPAEERKSLSNCVRQFTESGTPFAIEHGVILPDGSERVVRHEAEVVEGSDGADMMFIATAQDITDIRMAEDTIFRMTNYDGLTRLPNRSLLKDRLEVLLEQADRYDRLLAVLSVGLDRFKRVNDSLGRAAGDRVLREVATRLVSCLRQSDQVAHRRGGEIEESFSAGGTIGRIGGDEFVVLLSELRRFEDAGIVAQRLKDALLAPFCIDDREIFVTASVGIALRGLNGEDVEGLLKNADAARHDVRANGGDGFQFHSDSINARSLDRLSLEGDLRRAIERQEFTLFYQPVLDARTADVVGAEGLVRWRRNDGTLVSPGDFIPLAEETGLVVPLGNWVLGTAFVQRRDWEREGVPPLKVSVNVSARQFTAGGFVTSVAQALETTGLDPRQFELEITEGILMENVETSTKVLRELKSMGVGISLDDFGTGYSSLSYLKRFPIDTVKIDRTFVSDVNSSSDSAAIVTAILAMANSLGLKVIAEGVETEQQLGFLRSLDCAEVQGFLFSRPKPPEEFRAWLAGWKRQ